MREVVLDTETTGLNPEKGDRIIEIGCVETWNHGATGRTFHKYICPDFPLSPESIQITGLTDVFLQDKPRFYEVYKEFIDFIGDDPLVIHNAAFDIKFLNSEVKRCGGDDFNWDRIVDTLKIARKRFPGAQASLDALCRRFHIDNSSREKHGALLDAELLAEVYLELRGGRQPGLELSTLPAADSASVELKAGEQPVSANRPPRRQLITADEAEAHAAFVESLGDGALWKGASVP